MILLSGMVLNSFAVPIRVAVLEESFSSQVTGAYNVNAAPVKSFLEDDDNYDFDATFVSKSDVEAGALSLGAYDTFLVGGLQRLAWSDNMALQTRDFVLSGGGYVGIGWGATFSTRSLSTTGYGYLREFQPTTQTNGTYDNQSGVAVIIDPLHDIAAGLPGTFMPAQTSCCSMITDGANFDPRAGATVVATNGGDALVIADDSGLGRGVYFGLNIGSYNIFADQVDAQTELFLENALAWSAKSTSVPAPASIIFLLMGCIGMSLSRKS